jgi:hypothetical protein
MSIELRIFKTCPRRLIVAKAVITIDEQQAASLEQILIDRDVDAAWEFLAEIRAKVRACQSTRCGIEKLRKGL